jgi:predicted acetyltransferase
MRGVIAQGAEEDCGLSLLFPATTAPYRALGYEHAGTFTRYRLRARPAPKLDSPMRPAVQEQDWPGILACHERAASRLAGPEVRGEERWAALRRSPFVYVLDGDAPGSVEAYALFDHTREPGDWRYTVAIRDWAALTRDGLAAVIGLVAVHGSFGKDATFRGPTPELWSLFVAEQDIRTDSSMFWMARGLDLPAAVAARGFPSTVTATATFTVDDPLLPAARGPWRLEIAQGHGLLSPSPDAQLRLDARAVGPLFTGMYQPVQLALAGLVSGPADAMSALAAAFAGPLPVLLDFF